MNGNNYLIEIRYDGTGFSGWQIQPDKLTVQGVIEEKLSCLYNTKVGITGAGRTDAGVHALGMTASFSTPGAPVIPMPSLHRALNSLLPDAVHIVNLREVQAGFNARFDATGKAYTYVIFNSAAGSPFNCNWSWRIAAPLKISAMRKAASYLTGEHDFSAFGVALNKNKKNPVREIYKIGIKQFDNYVCLTFIGKSFLYKMVRNLVGALINTALGKLDPIDVKKILESRKKTNLFKTVPAHGLFLMKVFYRENEWKTFDLEDLPFS